MSGRLSHLAVVTGLSTLLVVGVVRAQAPQPAHEFRVVTVAEDLEHPWSMDWLPNGDMLLTERPGRLRIIRDGELLPDPVPGVPDVTFDQFTQLLLPALGIALLAYPDSFLTARSLAKRGD